MRIRVGSEGGFCWGVKRAFDKVLGALADGGPVHTTGPLVHNEDALEMLQRRGLHTCDGIPVIKSGTVVIRAHGLPPDDENELRDRGLTVVDATCPHVRRIQKKVEEGAAEGRSVCIVGYQDHPEVVALVARAGEGCTVITSQEEVECLESDRKVLLVAQSTFNKTSFEKIRKKVAERCGDLTVFDSICNATIRRQDEVRRLAREYGAVVVVGSRTSSNTRRLVEIAREEKADAYLVTKAAEIKSSLLSKHDSIAITAGASTPSWVIQEVIDAVTEIGTVDSRGASSVIRRIAAGIIESGLYVSCAAAALTAAACFMQTIPVKWQYIGASFSYIFSIYSLTRLQRKLFHHPTRRVAFLRKHPSSMLLLAIGLALAALAISLSLGLVPAILVGASYLLGILYQVRLAPQGSRRRYKQLQDIPASKDIFEAGAWSMICCVVPFLDAGVLPFGPVVLNVCAFVFVTVIVRATVYDSVDIQGDRVLGRETLPAVLGETRTWTMLWLFTLAAAVSVLTQSLLLFNAGMLVLLGGPMCVAVYLPMLRSGRVRSENVNAAIVDGELFLLGVLACAVMTLQKWN